MNTHDLNASRIKKLARLEDALGYAFSDISILDTALTHSSWANEHGAVHNERLEFLGDAVLELVISREIFHAYPEEREGAMTKIRSHLVSEERLCGLAEKISLGKYLRIGRGEEGQGGRERPSLLADSMEAVFGAVFLDGGYFAAQQAIVPLYEGMLRCLEELDDRKDYKTQLQEATQSLLRTLPVYIPAESQGPDHAKEFSVCLRLSDGKEYSASGSSLKRAEQKAAKMALDELIAAGNNRRTPA